jgi:hypothetical protein
MTEMLAVGGPVPEITPNWDFWLPAYMVLSLLLIAVFVRVRITPWTGIACLVSGTLWAWLDNAIGVLPAGAVAVLVALLAGAVLPRISPSGRGR